MASVIRTLRCIGQFYLVYMDVEIYLVEHILTRLPVEEHGNVK